MNKNNKLIQDFYWLLKRLGFILTFPLFLLFFGIFKIAATIAKNYHSKKRNSVSWILERLHNK